MQGGLTLSDEGLSKELALSDEQKTSLRNLVADMEIELEEMAANSAGGPMNPMFVRKQTGDKILSLLTPDQKKKWESMLGPKFEIKGPAKSSPATSSVTADRNLPGLLEAFLANPFRCTSCVLPDNTSSLRA